MKAVVKTQPGKGNIDYIDFDEPLPGPGEVKVRVEAAGICGTDLHIYHDEFVNYPPVVLGHEFSGQVVSVGQAVEYVKVGQRVVAESPVKICNRCIYCRSGYPSQCLHRRGLGWSANGAFAQFVVVEEPFIHTLPDSISYEEGALLEPLAFCYYAVCEQTGVKPGDLVYVSGPGPIGLLAAQLASKCGGIVIVGGREQDGMRLDLALDMGASRALVVDIEDPIELINHMTDGLGVDTVFECSGTEAGAKLCLQLVRKRGRYTQIGFFGKPISIDFNSVVWKNVRVQGVQGINYRSWERAIKLVEQGRVLLEPLITHRLPLCEWHHAFELLMRGEGIKIILLPDHY